MYARENSGAAGIMRAHRVLLVVFVLFVARPEPAEAGIWNPLKAAAKKVKAVLRGIGGVIGAPAGGFVESLSAPTIRNVEDTGRRLMHDAEDALERRVDQVGGVASRLIAETDQDLAARVAQVDRSIEARILQVEVAANRTLDHAFGRLDRSLGRIDAIARKRIDQIAAKSNELIDHAGDEASELLAQADAVLERRIEDVRQLVHATIQEADHAAEARIAQLDEMAGRRIKNLDVVATRLSLNAERAMLRIAGLVALVAFIGFVLWRLFVEAGNAWKTSLVGTMGLRVKQTAARASPRFFTQLAFAVAAGVALWLVADHLPKNAEDRARAQVELHTDAMGAALAAYDFAMVKYHASQLEVLGDGDATRIRVVVRKAELLQTVFLRPGVLQSAGGLRKVMADVAAIERELVKPDADIAVIKCYVLWQVAATRSDEYDAASWCADALEMPPSELPGGFMLGALAHNYVGAFLHDPYQPLADAPITLDQLARLRRVHDKVAATELAKQGSPQFQHVLEFNRLIAELDRASGKAYLEMLSAHAETVIARAGWKKPQPEPPALRAALSRRLDAARSVIDAWRTFDRQLEESPWLADDPTALAAFTLDDAVLSHALYFEVVPEADHLPPRFLAEPPAETPKPKPGQKPAKPAAAPKLTPDLRVKTAPLRIAWARRYASLIGNKSQELLAFEETARFRAFEERAARFEVAYVELQVALHGKAAKELLATKAAAAALAAAQMGLHRDGKNGRTPEAARIVEDLRAAGADLPPETGEAIAAELEARRLRFL
jgi:hypothetical protein